MTVAWCLAIPLVNQPEKPYLDVISQFYHYQWFYVGLLDVYYKIGVSKTSANFTRKYLWHILFFDKVAGLGCMVKAGGL